MNQKIVNQKAISQKAMNQKVFKSFFFFPLPPNNAFEVEKTLLFQCGASSTFLLSCSYADFLAALC